MCVYVCVEGMLCTFRYMCVCGLCGDVHVQGVGLHVAHICGGRGKHECGYVQCGGDRCGYRDVEGEVYGDVCVCVKGTMWCEAVEHIEVYGYVDVCTWETICAQCTQRGGCVHVMGSVHVDVGVSGYR